MTSIRDSARISVGGRDGDDIAQKAYILWSRVLVVAKRQNKHANGTYRFRGSLRRHVLDIWPGESTASPEKIEAFSRPIYAYLYATENARCESPNSRPPVWVVSDTWRGGYAPRREESPRELQQRRAEAKITPQEAGEDREPGPVTIKRRKVTTDSKQAPTQAALDALQAIHEQRRTQHEDTVECVYLTLAKYNQPLVADEIAAELGLSSSGVRDMLRELLASGRVFARRENAEERALRAGGPVKAVKATLYSNIYPVTIRTKRRVVPNFILEPSAVNTHASSKKLDYEFYKSLASFIARGVFTVQDVADKVSASREAVRRRFNESIEAGLIVTTPKKRSGSSLYRVPSSAETALRKLRDDAKDALPGKPRRAPRPPVPPFKVVEPISFPAAGSPEPEDDTDSQIVQAIRELVARKGQPDPALVAEIERLKAENIDLRAQLDTIRRALSG